MGPGTSEKDEGLGCLRVAFACSLKSELPGPPRCPQKLALVSVQLAFARQGVKERESSDDGVAGWMTATARADIGARFEARSISVGLG
jgi:hypothetical protein